MANVKVYFFNEVDLENWHWPCWWPGTCYQQKGLVTRYTHVKYEGPNSYQSKDISNVKVIADKQTDKRKGQAPDLSMQGHKNMLLSEFNNIFQGVFNEILPQQSTNVRFTLSHN